MTPAAQIQDGVAPARLLSLDVFRGLVILAMLIVNNIATVHAGYLWRHADWREGRFGESFERWWAALRDGATPIHAAFTQFPLWRHCTLADFVMPMFMLIIGLAIPFSAASAARKGLGRTETWLRVGRRAVILVALGWILCYFRDQFPGQVHGERSFSIALGMDVLQLLGVSYLFARLLYELPRWPRVGIVIGLFLWHWAFLKFGSQGDVPRGTFEMIGRVEHSSVKYAYDHWPIWGGRVTSWLSISWVGMLSVPPAVATMLLGSIAGDLLRNEQRTGQRARDLFLLGAVCAVAGIAWAFDLPMNKPRWTPSYLLYAAGVGFMLIALLHRLLGRIEARPRWTLPLVALGVNAIAAYFLTILVKVLALNVPRVTYAGERMNLGQAITRSFQDMLGSEHAGGWLFTLLFVAVCWAAFVLAYRRGWVWRV